MSSKRQIILAALVVALGAAVYLNWVFTSNGDSLTADAEEAGTSLGDVIYVGETNIDGLDATLTATAEEYFSTARLSRKKTRDEAISVMQETITAAEDDDVKLSAADTVLQLANNIEAESRIENLVLAKGFADCMAYVDGESVNVVVAVSENGLTPTQAAQIHDIAINETGVSCENIRIIEMK